MLRRAQVTAVTTTRLAAVSILFYRPSLQPRSSPRVTATCNWTTVRGSVALTEVGLSYPTTTLHSPTIEIIL